MPCIQVVCQASIQHLELPLAVRKIGGSTRTPNAAICTVEQYCVFCPSDNSVGPEDTSTYNSLAKSYLACMCIGGLFAIRMQGFELGPVRGDARAGVVTVCSTVQRVCTLFAARGAGVRSTEQKKKSVAIVDRTTRTHPPALCDYACQCSVLC